MNISEKFQNKEVGLVILRIGIGMLMLLHGIANMSSNYAFIKSLLNGIGVPGFMAYAVFIGEIVAPIFIIIGFRARLAGLILGLNMTFAILLAHVPELLSLNQFGGWAIELQALYLLGSFSILFLGAGKYALSSSGSWD